MAISSSCGALDNIVVDTIDTAQKCVTFLKEQNIGVATFIGLDKVTALTSMIGDLWRSCWVDKGSHSSSPLLR